MPSPLERSCLLKKDGADAPSFFVCYRMPRPLSSVFSPMRISTIPPNRSAGARYLSPKMAPTLTPIPDKTQVMQPMSVTAGRI